MRTSATPLTETAAQCARNKFGRDREGTRAGSGADIASICQVTRSMFNPWIKTQKPSKRRFGACRAWISFWIPRVDGFVGMRSVDLPQVSRRCASRLLVGVAAITAACSMASFPPDGRSNSVAGRGNAVAASRDWRKSVEDGPLYKDLVTSGLKQCGVDQDDGAVVARYSFADASSLTARRDTRIEYLQWAAHFANPQARKPLALLKSTEQAEFGSKGCGIDWQHPETEKGESSGSRDTVFRGDVCNCQARIHRDSSGLVVGVRMSSAC